MANLSHKWVQMTKRIYGLCEAAVLAMLGVATLLFALSANYGLLMNVKFKWLTVTGAALMLLMGLIALSDSQKRSGLNTLIFCLMLLVALIGKPYLPDANSVSTPDASLQAGLWDQIDQTRFPKRELRLLVTSDADDVYQRNTSFATVGSVKRLEALDSHGSFALMTSLIYCCLADMIGIGLRVPCDDLENFKDDQWLMISGKLVQEKAEITVPNFRFGRAMMASVSNDYYLRPEKIMSYNRIDQLPLLADKIMNGQSSQLFGKALKESGIWEDLEQEGPFTVFLPVDRAVEDLWDGQSFEELSRTELRRFVSSHIVNGRFFERSLMEQETVQTLNGRILQVEFANGKIRIDQSRLLLKDAEARNGVIHFIYPAISPNE